MLRDQVVAVKTDLEKGQNPTGQKSVFYDMITNDHVRPEEKTTDHLVLEAVTVISAGMNTTAHILSIIIYNLLQDPGILRRLQEELASVMSHNVDRPSWQTIEQLPYVVSRLVLRICSQTHGMRLTDLLAESCHQ